MKKIFRSKKIMLLAALVVIYGIWHMKYHHSSKAAGEDAVVVDMAKVKIGSIPVEVQAVGTLVAAKSVVVTPEVAGQVQKIIAQDGAFVEEGAPILQLDDTVNKAKADSAKAALTFSESNYNRMTLLGKKGAISQQAIEQALADYKEKKAVADESRILVNKMQLTAPFSGVLGKVKVNPGEYITVGQQIVTLTDVRDLRVEFNVPDKYLAQLKIGQQVALTTSSYPGQYFYGKVAFISPTINTEDHTLSIYADVPNLDNKLTAGLFVNVVQSLGNQNNVLLIPATSLVATIDGQEVYKVVNGNAVSTPVKIGQRTSEMVQIVDGVTAKDSVVTAGQQKLRDGTPVKMKV